MSRGGGEVAGVHSRGPDSQQGPAKSFAYAKDVILIDYVIWFNRKLIQTGGG